MKNLIATGAIELAPESFPRVRDIGSRRRGFERDDIDLERDLRDIMRQQRRNERRAAVEARGRFA